MQFYQVDAYGREVGYVDDFPPINPEPGRNIITTIDINIQYALEEIMKGERGVVKSAFPNLEKYLEL